MANDFYAYDDEDHPKGRDNLFLWTVFILLLIGLAFACWLGSFYIFGHPEQPGPYKILKKLKKIEQTRRFEVTAAPPGEFLSAQKLFERYSSKKQLELSEENALLTRNFIKNFQETKKLVPYIKGRFNIIDSYELSKTDYFDSGVVALAQSVDFPQVLIEHIYTAPAETVPLLRKMLQTGLDMSIERTLDLSAVIHIERVYDGRLLFTVVPLLYGSYALKQGTGTFSLEPPVELNPAAGLPVTKSKELQDGMRKFAEFRRKHPVPTGDAAAPAAPAPSGPELVRLDAIPEGTKPPPTGALPEMPVATPVPVKPARPTPPLIAMNGPTPKPIPPTMPVATPIPIAPAVPAAPAANPATMPPPAVAAAATPPPRMSPQGVPLTPFIAANPAPGLPSATSGNWRTYSPGKLPPGRTITAPDAGALAERGDLGERIYLRGQFLVTAAGENKAVLRPQVVADPGRPAPTPTRVIVEFPMGAVPPTEGSSVTRDDARAFEVRDVRRGADGQINIYVRELITPQ